MASSALMPFAGLDAFNAKAKEMKEEIGKAKTKQKLLKVGVIDYLRILHIDPEKINFAVARWRHYRESLEICWRS